MFAPYRPLKFDVRGPFCSADECKTHPDLAAMQFNVKEVLGTSARVAEGERYVVRGEYTLPGTDPFGITPAVFERACGATAHLLPGKGRFETCTEILKLTENPPNGLGVVVANERAGKCEIVRWTILAE
jgi:hypothetical protein